MTACNSGNASKNNAPMNENKIKIVYVYDALCGWCYGFSPVIEQIKENYQDDFEFEIVSGGLKIGDAVGPIGVVAPYIKEGAYKKVEQTCGVKFGDAFINGPLEEGTMIANSEPPAIALSIVKDKMPEKAFEFGSILHKALYVDGMEPEDTASYGYYAEKVGLDSSVFVADMKDPKYRYSAISDFNRAQQLGVTGFPALIAQTSDTAYLISSGYRDYKSISKVLDQIKGL